ncbi:45535_t:CDS:1, partial [Gigaspora margarita]
TDKEGYDIIGLAKTKLYKNKTKFLLSDNRLYKGFWSSAECKKHKGSGVEVLVHKYLKKAY